MMKYIKDASTLGAVAQVLASNEADIKPFYRSQFALQVEGKDPLEKMTTIFFTQTKARRAATMDKSMEALRGFEEKIKGTIENCRGKEPKEAHSCFLEWLCSIKNINQKIANLFIKFLVMFSEDFQIDCLDFPAWKEHLHVPLDRWVIRLMSEEYLAVGTDTYNKLFKPSQPNYVPYFPYNSSKESGYQQLQEELKEATSLFKLPSITLDALWFVHFNFCNYYSEDYSLCGNCWIKKQCKKGKYDQAI